MRNSHGLLAVFQSMNWSWQRLFSRTCAFVGLLLAASLAHAGVACVSDGPEARASRGAAQDRCLTASTAADACIVVPQRIDVRVSAGNPSSPDTPAAAGGAEDATRTFPTVAASPLPLGLAPASPVPVYILLRRYLS